MRKQDAHGPHRSPEKPVQINEYILLFLNYIPLEKRGALHLNKLESPLPKGDLC